MTVFLTGTKVTLGVNCFFLSDPTSVGTIQYDKPELSTKGICFLTCQKEDFSPLLNFQEVSLCHFLLY